MALVTRAADASIDAASAQLTPPLSGNLYAGENLDKVAACFNNPADGLVYMSNAAAADVNAGFDGFTARAVLAGEPVTLHGAGVCFRYSDGNLTPGTIYYMAATDGRLDTAAQTGDNVGLVKAIDANDVRVIRHA